MRKSFQKPSSAAAASNVGAKCQKCLKEGHWTADCPNERVYKPRPSRTALLFNPKLKLPEASMVKDDFIEERQSMKPEKEPESEEGEINEIPDADTFANQLIEEVKLSQNNMQTKPSFEDRNNEYKRDESNLRDQYRRRRSHSRSPSRSRSRSPPRYRTRKHRPRSRTPETVNPIPKNEKIYSEYASDSDFSSDSD